jgi:hypothetical protein
MAPHHGRMMSTDDLNVLTEVDEARSLFAQPAAGPSGCRLLAAVDAVARFRLDNPASGAWRTGSRSHLPAMSEGTCESLAR